MISGPHDLQCFIDAQEVMYDKALAELKAGRKLDHWMWFIFPQTAKVGMSTVSRQFAIRSLDEARAYLEHPLLGTRRWSVRRLCFLTRKQYANRSLMISMV